MNSVPISARMGANCMSIIFKLAAVPKMSNVAPLLPAMGTTTIGIGLIILRLLILTPAGLELKPPEDPLVLLHVLAHVSKVGWLVNNAAVAVGSARTANST